jgi:proteasome accessory factor C
MAKSSTEDRLKRILAMVPWVVAHVGPTVSETCERFACTASELANDIELLYLCGLYPYTPDLLIEAAIVDGRVFIQYADYFSRPLRLTPSEGLTLIAAATTLLATPGTDPTGPLARGLSKLSKVIGGAVDVIDVDLGEVSAETLATLRDAATAREQLRIDYYAFGRDDRTSRVIEPAGVFSTGGQWYVSAYCHLAVDERVFRIDRILGIEMLGRPATGPTIEAKPALFERRAEAGQVRLFLQADAAWVVEQYPVERSEVGPGGTLDVTLAVSEWSWLDRLVLRLGHSAEVIEAPIGWPGVAAAASRVLTRYGSGNTELATEGINGGVRGG